MTATTAFGHLLVIFVDLFWFVVILSWHALYIWAASWWSLLLTVGDWFRVRTPGFLASWMYLLCYIVSSFLLWNLRVILQFHRCVTSTFLKQVLLKVASALILVTSGGCALKQACNCCYLVRDSFAPLFCLCINCHTVVVMMASKNDGQWHVVPLSFRSPFFVRFIIFLIFTLNKNHLLFYSSQWWVNFSRMVTSFLCVHSLKTGWQHNQPQVICHA